MLPAGGNLARPGRPFRLLASKIPEKHRSDDEIPPLRGTATEVESHVDGQPPLRFNYFCTAVNSMREGYSAP